MRVSCLTLAAAYLAAMAVPVVCNPVPGDSPGVLGRADNDDNTEPSLGAEAAEGPGCHNRGTAWALFANVAGGNNDLTYSNFDPSVAATQSPYLNRTAKTLGGLAGSGTANTQIYHSRPVQSTNFVLHQVGYVIAKQAGLYTATIADDVDDIALVWWGAPARSGYTRDNANASLAYYQTQNGVPAQSASVLAAKGSWIPFRFVFAQGGGPFRFNANITAPDGSLLIGPSSLASPQVARFSCDNEFPPFPSWSD